MSDDLYQQAACLLRLVRLLDESLCSRPGDPFGLARAEQAWAQLLHTLIAAGKGLPAESSPLADWIRELGRAAKSFNELVQKHGMHALVTRFDVRCFYRLVDSGERLMREFRPKLADPFAFVEPPPAKAAPSILTETPNETLPRDGKKPKRSTQGGEARAKLIAALTKHHQYANGGCLNLEPIGNNQLAKLADVSASTASAFFNDQFQGHEKYKAMCRDAGKLAAALKLLNDEFAPHHLMGPASSNLAAPEQDDADPA